MKLPKGMSKPFLVDLGDGNYTIGVDVNTEVHKGGKVISPTRQQIGTLGQQYFRELGIEIRKQGCKEDYGC